MCNALFIFAHDHHSQVAVDVVGAHTLHKQPMHLFKIIIQAPSDPDLILTASRTLIHDLVHHHDVQEAVDSWGQLVAYGSGKHTPVSGGSYNGVQLAGVSFSVLD